MRRRDLLTGGMASALVAAALLRERPAAGAPPSPAAAYPLPATDVKTLRARCAPLLALDEAALLRLVPPQGGFWFSECPNCDQGAQEHQLVWTPEMGETVQCQFCKQVYPNARYPENGAVTVRTPSGGRQAWRFHEDKDGQRYWYEARRWYEQREYAEAGAFDLAQLWARAGDQEAGRRAALLLVRFAALYPDYVVRFDYPHKPKRFFEDAVPADFEPYRAAKWSWWAYADVSVPLLRTFDLLRGSSDLLPPADAARVENDLLRAMLAFVARYDGKGRLTNMHPTTWTSMAVASRVLNDPAIAAKAREQMGRLIDEQFFADGMYREGTASYHEQTAKGLRRVLQSLYPDLEGAAALDARIAAEFPDLDRALQATRALRTPDGRFAPLRDTWAADKSPAGTPDASRPALLPGVGYAVLGMGDGAAQFQAHLGFVGRFGHDHYDSLNLLLYGSGRDLASDLGYTHSRARPWTLSTASHNTVVIDSLSQSRGGDTPDRCRGRLLLFDGADATFQMVEAEAPTAYPDLATLYRRSLIAVASGNVRYVVDVFDVAGGSRHDWLLHGSADEEQTLEVAAEGAPLTLAPAPTLLPTGHRFREPRNEGDAGLASDGPWAYGMFRGARTGQTGQTVVATFRGVAAPRVGLRTWILGAPGTDVATARAWAVREIGRPTQEDDGKLDRRMRQALIVGRDGGTSRFVAVHCPFEGGDPGVRRVTRLPLEPGGFLLRVERADGGIDRLLFGPDAAPRTGVDGDLRLGFDGRAALVSEADGGRVLKMIGGTRLACGGETLTAPAAPPARLRKVSGRELTLAGSVPLEPGMTVVVRHGDGTTNGFQVASVRRAGGDTVVTTREAAALTGSPDGPLTLRTFPQTTHPGPHEVRFVTRAGTAAAG